MSTYKVSDALNSENGTTVTLLTIASFILYGAYTMFTQSGWQLGTQLYTAFGLTVLGVVILIFRAEYMRIYGTEPISFDPDAIKASIKAQATVVLTSLDAIISMAQAMNMPADKIALLQKQRDALQAIVNSI